MDLKGAAEPVPATTSVSCRDCVQQPTCLTWHAPSASQDHFTFRSHLCIAFEPLALNLYEFIKQNSFAGLSLGLIRRFAHQILVSLKFMKVGRARRPRSE